MRRRPTSASRVHALVAPGGEDRGVAGADAGADRAGSGTGEVAGYRVGPPPVGRDDGAGPVEHGDGLAQCVQDAALRGVAGRQRVDRTLALHGVPDGTAQDLGGQLGEQRVVLGALVHGEDADALVLVVVDEDHDGQRRGSRAQVPVPAPARWSRQGAGSAVHRSAARRRRTPRLGCRAAGRGSLRARRAEPSARPRPRLRRRPAAARGRPGRSKPPGQRSARCLPCALGLLPAFVPGVFVQVPLGRSGAGCERSGGTIS